VNLSHACTEFSSRFCGLDGLFQQTVNGIAVGYGPGVGVSVSSVYTWKYTISDLGSDISDAWNWVFN
jgi:hypothetical protein